MTYREKLKEVADGQYGFISTSDAIELGVPPIELRKLASRGKLNHVRRGVYKFPEHTPGERDAFAAALAEVGPGAYLVADSVLALHGLAFVNPKKIRVATSQRVRHVLPDYVSLEKRTSAKDSVETYEGLLTMTVANAILDSRGIVMNERLVDALNKALAQGLVTKSEFQKVGRALRASAAQ